MRRSSNAKGPGRHAQRRPAILSRMPDQTPPPADLPRLPQRAPDSHKGTYGTVGIIGGCAATPRMIGAPALVALAALRAGAGLARILAPEPILDHAIAITPSATGLPIPVGPDGHIVPHEATRLIDEAARFGQCLAVGPGLGTGEGPRAATLRAVQQEDCPVVVDADGINALAAIPELPRDLHAAAVLTPHPGEFRRLAESMGLRDLGLSQSRERAAEQLAQRLGVIVVLKGSGTVVSDGARTWTNPTGHPCLATAGTGDILTGLIAGLVAQFVDTSPPLPEILRRTLPRSPEADLRPLDLFDAARLGVYLHGVCGQRWAERTKASGGLLAAELASFIPEAVEGMREG